MKTKIADIDGIIVDIDGTQTYLVSEVMRYIIQEYRDAETGCLTRKVTRPDGVVSTRAIDKFGPSAQMTGKQTWGPNVPKAEYNRLLKRLSAAIAPSKS